MWSRILLSLFLIWIFAEPCLGLEVDESIPVVPTKKGFWFRSRIRKRPRRMNETGVKLVYWQPVLQAAFLKRLKREPTPAEYEFQDEVMRILVSELVTHTEIDEEGHFNPLPPEEDDHKLVRISGFDVIDLNRKDYEIPDVIREDFLCVEGYCFVPRLFSLRSELIFQQRDYILLRRTQNEGVRKKRKKAAIECPRFQDRTRHPLVVSIPIPKIRHHRIKLLYANLVKGVFVVHRGELAQYQFEEITPPPKQTSP